MISARADKEMVAMEHAGHPHPVRSTDTRNLDMMSEAHIDGSSSSRSGRKRPLWAVPAEEIQSRRDEWLPHLEGKTTAEIHRWAGFEGLPISTAEVWLWAVVHLALDLTCGPDGRWGLENGPQEVPVQLRSLVERWQARMRGRNG